MKRLFYIAAAAIAVLSACTKEDPFVEVGTEPESVSMPVFKATIEGPATKTTLGVGDKVEWENGDEVFMFFTNEGFSDQAVYVYEATPGVDASTATLTHKSYITPDNPAADRLMYAIYPASLFKVDVNVGGLLYFPDTQVYGGDDNISFAPMACMNFSDSDRLVVNPTPENLTFKNAAALLEITVPYSQMESVQSITVSSDKAMHGRFTFELLSEGAELWVIGEPTPENSYVTLDCAAGNGGSNVAIPADASKTFYISIPVNIYGYLQIDVTDGTTTKSMRTLKASGIDIERNMIYPLNFVENYSPAPAYEYVDLGLSVKWATCNLGASAPEETGLYYQWGDTQGYGSDPESDGKYFDWSNPMAHYDHYSDLLTKYNRDEGYGTVDNKTVLDLEDDAAHAALGGTWRIPTTDEFEELIDNSTLTWTTINGMNGVKFQSKIAGYTDKWIFIPAAGYRSCDTLNSVGRSGYYWSSTLCSFAGGDSWSADALIVSEDNIECNMQFRVGGQPIRPVCE